MKDKGRIFKVTSKDGKERVLRLNRPSQKVLSKGDFIYRQYFSSAIRAGILTNAEANKLLKDREIWNEEKEDEAASLRSRIKEIEDKLEAPSLSNTSGKKLCDELTKLRRELNDHNALYNGVTDNTAESVAHEARIKYWASECTVDNDTGEKLFSSLENFDDSLGEPEAVSAYREALIANFERILGVAMPDGLAAELPENKWLKDRGLLEGDKAVDELEKPIKKTRKKRTTKVKA